MGHEKDTVLRASAKSLAGRGAGTRRTPRFAGLSGSGETRTRTGDTTIFSRVRAAKRGAAQACAANDIPAKCSDPGGTGSRVAPAVVELVDATWTYVNCASKPASRSSCSGVSGPGRA